MLVAVLDPYGASPIGLPLPRPLMDSNQRFMYPQVIRAGTHDSLALGTSTTRLLVPADLNEAFGGSFANLALNAGRAWEQYRLFDLFLREHGPPRTLLVGIDGVWCDPTANETRITPRGFPEWLFGEPRPWDVFRMLNFRTVEIAVRQIGLWLGTESPAYDADGFDDFTTGNWADGMVKFQGRLWGDREPLPLEAFTAPAPPPATPYVAPDLPAMAWLEEMLARAVGSDVILLVMPVHLSAQPLPGTEGWYALAACKAQVRSLAEAYGATFVDLNVPSPMTADDQNYWDPVHWRLPLGPVMIQAILDARSGATAR